MTKLTKINDKDKNNLQWKKFKHGGMAADCQHCKFLKAENSIPKDEWIVKRRNRPGTPLIPETIKEIKVIRGRYGDCVGWKY